MQSLRDLGESDVSFPGTDGSATPHRQCPVNRPFSRAATERKQLSYFSHYSICEKNWDKKLNAGRFRGEDWCCLGEFV